MRKKREKKEKSAEYSERKKTKGKQKGIVWIFVHKRWKKGKIRKKGGYELFIIHK